jgi:hypothetical protein
LDASILSRLHLPGKKSSSQMKPIENENHKAVERTLGYALTLGDRETWQAFSAVAAYRLTDEEKAALGYSVLSAQDPQNALWTAEAVLDNGAGPPLAPFMHVGDEAKFWASIASTKEIKVYTLAGFKAMRQVEQRAFLDFVSKEVRHVERV